MSRRFRPLITLSAPALAACLGFASYGLAQDAATKDPAEEARRKQTIVTVDGVPISVGRVEDFLAAQMPGVRERAKAPEEQKQIVENMVRMELLAAEAQRRGYDKNPAVTRTVKDSAVQALLRSEIDAKYSPQSIPQEEVKAYYDANPAEFHRSATRRASQIVLATEEEAKKLLPEAQKADVRGFSELAKQHSKDAATKLRGGDLGYFPREPATTGPADQVAPAVREAAFALKTPGETASKPVPVDGGFAIVRLTGERPERHTELADAESSIRTKLWREKRQKALNELIESLRAREKPQVFAERADLVKFDDMDKRPSGFSPERMAPGTQPQRMVPGTRPPQGSTAAPAEGHEAPQGH